MVVKTTSGNEDTIDYEYTFFADGRIRTLPLNYNKPTYKLSHHQYVSIQNELKKIDFVTYVKNKDIPQYIHDGQNKKLQAFLNGTLYNLDYRVGKDSIPTPVNDFIKYIETFVSNLND